MGQGALDHDTVRRLVSAALAEDLGERGDVTTDALLPAGCRGVAQLVSRSELVVAGLPVAREVFTRLDPSLDFRQVVEDGERVGPGRGLATVSGAGHAILKGERTALNFLMRMSGIATATLQAVDEIRGTRARILDTRKTVPGLRLLDKYAVTMGGGVNHRLGLYDAPMIKDTHLALCGSIREAVERLLSHGHPAETITVEVRGSEELEQAIRAGAGRALLDNMDLKTMRRCVDLAAGRIALEASGGLRLGALRAVAETGVDFLSLGWLTHSAPAADVAMEMETIR